MIHIRFYSSLTLYLAALEQDSQKWLEGTPEWQRKTPLCLNEDGKYETIFLPEEEES